MQKNGSASTFEHRLDALKDSLRNLVDAGGERAGVLKNKAVDVKDTVFASGEKAINQTSSLIRQHPFIALGIAFGVGYLAVRMMRK